MSPRLARAMEHASKAKRDRAVMAARGCCPTCWKKIPGLEPVESRPQPWTYCEGCRAGRRARLRERRAAAGRDAALAVLAQVVTTGDAMKLYRISWPTLRGALAAQRAEQARAA
jgi:hypothetical protein